MDSFSYKQQLSKLLIVFQTRYWIAFTLANANTAISQYYLLEKQKEELFRYDSLQGHTLNGWEAQLQELIGYVLEKDSLIAAGTPKWKPAGTACWMRRARPVHFSGLIENVLLQSQVALAQQALTDNAALTDTAVYQSNEKAFNTLFLNTLAQGTSAGFRSRNCFAQYCTRLPTF